MTMRMSAGVLGVLVGLTCGVAIDVRARELRVQIEKMEVRPPYDYERAFLTLKRKAVRAVLVVGSPVFFRDRAKIAELALRHRLPAGG